MNDKNQEKIDTLENKISIIENKITELQQKVSEKNISTQELETLKTPIKHELEKIRSEIISLKTNDLDKNFDPKTLLIHELIELKNNFQVDYNSEMRSATKGKVYISASPYDHFIFIIDFHKFPKKPMIHMSPETKKILKDSLDNISPTLQSWNKNDPGHLIDIFQEIESELIKKVGIEMDEEVSTAQKLAARRRSIILAQECEQNGEYSDAIWFLENAVRISEELGEKDKSEKYSQKIKELKQKFEEQAK
ncbi:MAG: hypothetical protein ACTSRP_15365 [Candidatus Helarchaeota archaeon]